MRLWTHDGIDVDGSGFKCGWMGMDPMLIGIDMDGDEYSSWCNSDDAEDADAVTDA